MGLMNYTKWIMLISLLVSMASGKVIIQKLRKLNINQQILEIGPSWHSTKQGTPTMGGLIFLIGFLVGGLLISIVYPEALIIIMVTLGFGAVGFIDDRAKILKKQNEGLTPKQKIVLQLIIVSFLMIYLIITKIGMYMYIPFVNGRIFIGYLFIPMLFIIVLGTVNGVNLTDGIDGLAGCVTFVVCIFMSIMGIFMKQYNLSYLITCMGGGLIGFLFYNIYPAKVFMGDTGSLALGGFIATCAYMLQAPIYIAIFGIIYLIECLSVIIQVWYAKTHNGKRIFKMAPIHHHFEKSGWSENKIVTVFSIITFIAGVISVIIFYRGLI